MYTGEGEEKYRNPPQANYKRLVNKNAIKPKIAGPRWQIFPESLDPSGKNLSYPLPWIFNQCAYLVESLTQLTEDLAVIEVI